MPRLRVKICVEEDGYCFFIPSTLPASVVAELNDAWNGGYFAYQTFEDVFQRIGGSEERLEIALEMARMGAGEDSVFYRYLKRVGKKAAEKLFAERDEATLVRLTKDGIFSESALRWILERAQISNMAQEAAYAMEKLGKKASRKRKGVSYRL